MTIARARTSCSRFSSGSSIESSNRQAVRVDATYSKRSGCCRTVSRSAMHSPPSASVTAKSTKTRPESSPLRSASSARSLIPAWPTSPVPSALTRSRGRPQAWR